MPPSTRRSIRSPAIRIPTCAWRVVGSDGGKIKWINAGTADGDLPLSDNPNVLIPRFGWVRDGLLWAMALNRLQNRMDLYFVDVKNGKWTLMMTETTDAWIDMHPEVDFQILTSGDRYLWTSWRDGHNHIYLYQFDKQKPLSGPAKMVAQLTHGDWEVESIDGVDEKQGVVYFSANEGDWRQTNVYAVGLDGQNFHRVSKENGSHTADFDPKNSKYYVDRYSALTTPPTRFAVHGRRHLQRVLEAAQRRGLQPAHAEVRGLQGRRRHNHVARRDPAAGRAGR